MAYSDFLSSVDDVANFGEWYAHIHLKDANDAEVVLRVSRHGTPTRTDDTGSSVSVIEANKNYQKRIVEVPTITHSIWSPGTLGGRNTPSSGELIMENPDGGLDQYHPANGYAWQDCRVVIYHLDRRRPSTTWGVFFDGICTSVKFTPSDVKVELGGLETRFQQPLSQLFYRGGRYALGLAGVKKVDYGTPAAVDITGSMTLEMWIWVNAIPTTGVRTWGWGLAPGGGSSTTWPWSLAYLLSGVLRISGYIGGVEEQRASAYVMGVNKWYHVSIVIDGRDVIFRFWDDDLQVLTTETYVNAFSSATRQGQSGASLQVTTTTTAGAGDATYSPWFDEMRVWNVARGADDLEAYRYTLFPSGAIPASLVHYTRMDHASGTSVTDSSATGANGTISGAGTYGWIPTLQGSDELAGTARPDLWGHRFGVVPVVVDGVTSTYQIAGGGPIQSIEAIYEGGYTSYTSDGDAADYPTFLTTTPASGHYLTYLARGLFKLGSNPTKPITVDAKGYNGGALGYVETAADIIRDIVTRRGPKLTDPDDLDTAAFTAFETADDSPVGLFVKEPTKTDIDDALDQVAKSVMGHWGYARGSRLFSVGKFSGPAVTADFDFAARHIVRDTLDETATTRVYQVIVRYRPNDLAMKETDLAATVLGTADWHKFTQQYLEEKDTNYTLRARYPGKASQSVTVTTLLYNQADAQALAQYILNLLGGDSPRSFDVVLTSVGRQVSPGDTVTLDFTDLDSRTRLALDGATKFSVLTVKDLRHKAEVALSLWAPEA